MKCPHCRQKMEILNDGAYCLNGECPVDYLDTVDMAQMISSVAPFTCASCRKCRDNELDDLSTCIHALGPFHSLTHRVCEEWLPSRADVRIWIERLREAIDD